MTWTSSNPGVVKVEDGVLKGVGVGTAVIIVKSEDGAKIVSTDDGSVDEIGGRQDVITMAKNPYEVDVSKISGTGSDYDKTLAVWENGEETATVYIEEDGDRIVIWLADAEKNWIITGSNRHEWCEGIYVEKCADRCVENYSRFIYRDRNGIVGEQCMRVYYF